MQPARRHSLALIGVLVAASMAGAEPARSPEALRQAIEAAEAGRASALAARQRAAARAAAASQSEARLATGRIEAAQRLRQTETRLAIEADRMSALARTRAEVAARLDQRANDLTPLLPVILRLDAFPVETLVAMPGPADERLRGALVLRALATRIEADARDLRAREAALAAADAAIAAERPALDAAEAAQRSDAARLDSQLQSARTAHASADDEAAQVAREAAADAAHAADLRGMLARIEAEQRAAEARARAEAARAARSRHPIAQNATQDDAQRRVAELTRPAGPGLPAAQAPLSTLARAGTTAAHLPGAPVAGRVVRAFGASTEAGPAHGMSIETPPDARVVAPCTGRVVFAGPFRSFGPLVILDCGGGAHFVLAGLARLDVAVGRTLRQGEPVGVMPGWDPRTSGPRPALYVELRRGEQTVDPAPWLRGS